MKKLGMLIEFDFFDNSQWPGSSPDLNATENLGAILKKHGILKIPSMERNSVETLYLCDTPCTRDMNPRLLTAKQTI